MAALPRILAVFALPEESDGAFESAGVPVLYCGVGKINATRALTRELLRYASAGEPPPLVVNFGSAGSRTHDPHRFFACDRFVQRDMDASGLGFALGTTPFDPAPACLEFPAVFTSLPPATCGSGDSFATSDVGIACDVVDMEAYALAKVSWHEGAPFGCVKYVTDGADEAAARHWKDNVHKAAIEFLRLYRQIAARGG